MNTPPLIGDDDPTTTMPTPVGVTLARKFQTTHDLSQKTSSSKQPPPRSFKSLWSSNNPKKKENGSWNALVEGVTLYAICMFVPSAISVVLRLDYEEVIGLVEDLARQHAPGLGGWLLGKDLKVVEQIADALNETSSSTTTVSLAEDTYFSDALVVGGLTISLAILRLFLVHLLVPDNQDPQRMKALMKCKSLHLLSSGYKESLTPRMDKEIRRLVPPPDKIPLNMLMPPIPSVGDVAEQQDETTTTTPPVSQRLQGEDDDKNVCKDLKLQKSSSDLGLNIDEDEAPPGGSSCSVNAPQDDDFLDADDEAEFNSFLEKFSQAQPKVLLQQEYQEDDDGGGQQQMEDSRSSWVIRRSSSIASLAAVVAIDEEGEGHHDQHTTSGDHDPMTESKDNRINAAPRYATAVFRLLYSAVVCAVALWLFRDADFWPWYVMGHGSTVHCWDLSGGLALAKDFDSDFDHHNTVLRRFFLVQASYHLHSGAFHLASILLLLSLSNKKATTMERKEGWKTFLRGIIYFRSFFQHSLSLFWLCAAYMFSSIRRLGAIGLFAFDASNLTLHLLQSCINAPDDSFLRRPIVVKAIFGGLVIPSYCYFRFFVWPFLGYSAVVESKHWLNQLESTLVPGSALWMRIIFQVWIVVGILFHMERFRRLLFHPHLQRCMNPTANDATKVE